MSTNFQAFKLYFKLASVGFAGYYAYLYQKCNKYKKEFTDFDMIQSKKDTTRPSNVYYGINWGYRSDETIEKSLDTGDFLLYNYDCSKCFTPSDVIKCKI